MRISFWTSKINYLDTKFGSGGALDVLAIRSQGLVHRPARATVLVNNIRAAAGIQLSLEHAVELAPDGLEEVVALDAVDEVVGLALVLDHGAGLVGEDADLLMGLLARLAQGAQAHDDALGDHEGQLGLDVGGNALGVNDEAVGDVVEANEDGISQQEGLGDVDAAHGRII